MSNEIWFTSDLHFGHAGILKHTERGFADAATMDEAIIRNINSVVRPGDRVYHLGDFSFHRPAASAAILSRLMGEWHQINGNHDRGTFKGFASVSDYKRLKVGDQPIILHHYPIMSWHGMHRGAWHLHGHCHGNLREYCPHCKKPYIARRKDAGIDTHPNFMPYHFDEIAKFMRAIKEPTVVDHHEPR